MPKRQINLSLDFSRKDNFPKFEVKQFDSLTLNITPLENGVAYSTSNCKGKLYVGVYGEVYKQDTDITVNDNNIVINVDRNMLNKEGTAYAEVELSDNLGIVTSGTFIFKIVAKIGEGSTIPGNIDGFVAKYEKLMNEFKSRLDSAIKNSENNTNTTINNIKNSGTNTISMIGTNGENQINTFNLKSTNAINIFNENANKKILDVEKRFQTLTASKQIDSEIIIARQDLEGEIHESLDKRLEADLLKNKIIDENVEGTYITVKDSVVGNLSNIEILGNTTQDTVDLSDIKSVGELTEDGRYKMSILSCGKNLMIDDFESGALGETTGILVANTNMKTSKYIKIPKNKNYILNVNGYHLHLYDNTKTWAKRIGVNKFTSEIEGYIRLTVPSSMSNIQLEEGTVATTYEEPQYNKSSILLPCPLEKVGDVSDRLFRREDGVWCVEKNILTETYNGTENWGLYKENTNTIVFYLTINKTVSEYIGNTPVGGWHTDDTEGVSSYNTYIYIRILKSKLSSNNVAGWKDWLSKNNVILKSKNPIPQIIELPLDVQIQLNSFNGVTNIFTEDTVIEPTIKATVPKSLGASVNSLVNKTDILSDRVEKIENLQKGNEMEVSTDKKSVVVQSTNEGYITDFSIKGDTLVNLLDGVTNVSSSQIHCIIRDKFLFRGDKKYTIINLNNKPIAVGFYKYSDFTYNHQQIIQENSCIVIQDTLNYPRNVIGNFSDGWTSSDKLNALILEGDYTTKDISYFEGLKSVGDGVDKIELYSCGKNLFDGELSIGKVLDATGNVLENSLEYAISDFIKIPKCGYLTYSSNYSLEYMYFYDKSKSFITRTVVNAISKSIKVPTNCSYVRMRFYDSVNNKFTNNLVEWVQLEEGNNVTQYEPHKSTTKELLYKNAEGVWEKPVLRKVSEGVYDSIELHSDGKYYFHKRCGEVIFTGSESWVEAVGTLTNTKIYYTNDKKNFSQTAISNIPVLGWSAITSQDNPSIYVSPTGATYMRIPVGKTPLDYLSSNTVTVVYQLATEEIYECVNLDLDSYEGETSVIIDSGAISPKIGFKIASHIANTVQVLKDRINYLEDKVISMFKNVLAGDVQTLAYELYPEDFEIENKDEEIISDEIELL